MDEEPFNIGNSLIVTYRDGSERLAKIIDCRKSNKLDNENDISWNYYVHYNDFNRRMDEWIDTSRIIARPSEALVYDANLKSKSDSLSNDYTIESKQPTKKYRVSETHDSNSSCANERIQITTVSELDHDEHEGLDAASVLEHEEVTKVKNFLNVQFGKHVMECWYFSPLPKEYYVNPPIHCIYFCEFTFRFFKTKAELTRFQSNLKLVRHPPGDEIYRDSHLSMFEIDGAIDKIYCQNLCYFAKLFLDHKTLYWDVDPFLYYVLCTYDNRGYHPVGYFSKEKYVFDYSIALLRFNAFQSFS